MELVPQFTDYDLAQDPISFYKKPNTSQIKNELRKAYFRGGWVALEIKAYDFYVSFSSTKTYHSMMKHILESISHSASLAPNYIKMAQEKSLKSPKKLIWRFLNGLILSLSFASYIDHKAAPLQAQGLLIITQDVPQILE